MDTHLLPPHRDLAAAGLLAGLPAITLCSLGLLETLSSIDLTVPLLAHAGFLLHPVLVVGGALLGILLSLRALVHVQVRPQERLIRLLFMPGRTGNLGVLLLNLMLLGIIGLYVFAENFQTVAR